VLAATAAALALLANFHTSPEPSSVAAGRPALPTSPSTATTTPVAGAPPTSSTSTTAGASRTIDGPVVPTRYGDVQVRIVVRGGQLQDVQGIQLPFDRPRSARISDEAGPLLRSEALQAQSARIDVVSGATYTSEGYASSLQGALDRSTH
jgi:uncharacterized protein with FMN-binding domain